MSSPIIWGGTSGQGKLIANPAAGIISSDAAGNLSTSTATSGTVYRVNAYYPASGSNYWTNSNNSAAFTAFTATGTIPSPTVIFNNNFATPTLPSGNLPGLTFVAPITGVVDIETQFYNNGATAGGNVECQLWESTTSTALGYSTAIMTSTNANWQSIRGSLNVTAGSTYTVSIRSSCTSATVTIGNVSAVVTTASQLSFNISYASSISTAAGTVGNVTAYYPLSTSNYWSISTTSGGYLDFTPNGTIPSPTIINNNNFTAPTLATSNLPGINFTAPSTGTLAVNFSFTGYSTVGTFQQYYQIIEKNTSTVVGYATTVESINTGPWNVITGYLNVVQGTSYSLVLQGNGNGGTALVNYITAGAYTSPEPGLLVSLNYIGLTSITGSGITRSINAISSPTTAGAIASTDYVYLVSGTTTLTLPTAVGNTNLYTVKNTGVNTVSIATTSAQTIDGSASPITLPVANTSLSLISDNANWRLV